MTSSSSFSSQSEHYVSYTSEYLSNKRNKFHGTWIKTKQNRTEQRDELGRRPKIVTTCKAKYLEEEEAQERRRPESAL